MQQNGVLVLNKPTNCTSNACIQQIKRTLFQKKIGHAGTLDPMVDGVLLVLLGHATKISGYLMEDGVKTYKGILQIGYETDTWDREGEIVAEYSTATITEEMLKKSILEWIEIEEQEVPPISAAKFNGKPLYKLVRMGHTVPRKFKNVHIKNVEVISVNLPYATFRVTCGSGTYIRSLAHSLGKRLECGATLHQLTREYSQPFSLKESYTLDTVLNTPELLSTYVQPIQNALPLWEKIVVTEKDMEYILVGRPILSSTPYKEGSRAVLLLHNVPVALAVFDIQIQSWKIIRGL